MAPVARELSGTQGVLEPFFTGLSIADQIEELRQASVVGGAPVAIIGHSWGAWLAILFAARFPELTKLIVLVGCPPLAEDQAAGIVATRLSRLSQAEQERVATLTAWLDGPDNDKREVFQEMGGLISRADILDPLPATKDTVTYDYNVFARVWPEATTLRRDGGLLAVLPSVKCPVVAIQGDYDPHPAAAVFSSLSNLNGFRYVLLEECGHVPWRERRARTPFYEALKTALSAI